MNNGQEIEGLAEPDFKKAKVGENVQFERFGFVRIDSKKRGENIVCYFTHK
jgi:glutamyl-tRNA synthetase